MKHLGRMLALAGLASLATGGATFAAETVKLGHLMLTSGPLKGPGEPSNAAFDIAVAEINAAGGVNGKKIEVVKYNTGSDPRQASVGARKLAQDDGVLAIVGPFSSGEAGVAFNDAERLGVLMMPNAASRPGLTQGKSFAWRLTEDEDKQFRRLLQSLKRKNIKAESAEIIYVSDEAVANDAGTNLYPALLKEFGIKHGPPIAVQYKSFDVAPQIAKIVQSKPDLVAEAGLPESASKIIRELTRQGYKGRMIGSQIFSDPNIVELFGKEAEGALFMAGFWRDRTPKAAAFTKAFIEENARRGIKKLGAHHTDAQTYDTVYLVKAAMEKAKVTGDPAKLAEERIAIRDALKGITFSGILGDNLCFVNQDAELPGYVIEIRDGQWTKFDEWPADSCPSS